MRRRKKKSYLTRTDFPQGAVVKTESGHYFINGNTKKPIPHKRILDSWSFPLIIDASDLALSKFVLAHPLGYRDGTLIRDISDNAVYLIAGQKRRHIVDPDALDMIGRKLSDAFWVSHSDVELHKEGNDL